MRAPPDTSCADQLNSSGERFSSGLPGTSATARFFDHGCQHGPEGVASGRFEGKDELFERGHPAVCLKGGVAGLPGGKAGCLPAAGISLPGDIRLHTGRSNCVPPRTPVCACRRCVRFDGICLPVRNAPQVRQMDGPGGAGAVLRPDVSNRFGQLISPLRRGWRPAGVHRQPGTGAMPIRQCMTRTVCFQGKYGHQRRPPGPPRQTPGPQTAEAALIPVSGAHSRGPSLPSLRA